jgi:transposase
MSKQESIRDLIESGAPKYGLAPRVLWRRTLDAIQRNILSIDNLPAGMTLDTTFNHGGAPLTWRQVIASALIAIEGHIPSNDNWAKTLMLDSKVFNKWLKKVALDDQVNAPAKRTAGAKSSKREEVAEFIARNYPNGIPAKVTNKMIAIEYKAETGTAVSERTVRRALGRS